MLGDEQTTWCLVVASERRCGGLALVVHARDSLATTSRSMVRLSIRASVRAGMAASAVHWIEAFQHVLEHGDGKAFLPWIAMDPPTYTQLQSSLQSMVR